MRGDRGLAGRRVLLVEDDWLVRLLMVETLEEAGLDVVQASDGDEAERLIDGADGFDLLLTDVGMPGRLDGIGLAEHARERHPSLPVVYVTGRPDLMLGRTRLGPHDAFLPKPYGPFEVLAAVRRLLALPPSVD
jgi:CheY-like chemotaxis protein